MKKDLERLQDGILRLGLRLPEGAAEKLLAYRDLLCKWNRVYNLTALRDPGEMLTHHLMDSLAILPHLPASARALLDVGSGAGLPGIPLAIARPDLAVTLMDAVQKKTAFQRQAAIALELRNVEARHERVETATGTFDVIVSRAFAELQDFLHASAHLLAVNGVWLAMKGRNPQAELARLGTNYRTSVLPLEVPELAAERHLVRLQPMI
jgi:16S rRNA (guanine527-N7)-methyltransferase